MTKDQAAKKKAEWLRGCLECGWGKESLDDLSRIWDEYKDEYGNIRPHPESTTTLPVEEDLREKAAEYAFDKVPSNSNYASKAYNDSHRAELIDAYLAGAQQSGGVIADLEKQIRELQDWKESAISVTPDMQAIGKAIGVKLGDSVHDKILPWILNQKKIIQLK